jgi:hypothetical protein
MTAKVEDLEQALDGKSREAREAALKRLMVASWKDGWDAATADSLRLLRQTGAVATKPMLGWDPAEQ